MISRAWVSPQSANSANTSIARRTLRNVAVRITIVVASLRSISYWHVRTGIERQTLENLERYVEQRRVRESADLRTGEQQYRDIRDGLSTGDPADRSARGRAAFRIPVRSARDGTTRLREDAFNTHDVTGFIGRHVRSTATSSAGSSPPSTSSRSSAPAWARTRSPNLYVVTPEGAIIMYWPGQPWALEASDWEVVEQARAASPTRRTVSSFRRPRKRRRRSRSAGPTSTSTTASTIGSSR